MKKLLKLLADWLPSVERSESDKCERELESAPAMLGVDNGDMSQKIGRTMTELEYEKNRINMMQNIILPSKK